MYRERQEEDRIADIQNRFRFWKKHQKKEKAAKDDNQRRSEEEENRQRRITEEVRNTEGERDPKASSRAEDGDATAIRTIGEDATEDVQHCMGTNRRRASYSTAKE